MDSEAQRVAQRIGPAILDFVARHDQFTAAELRAYVGRVVGDTAPASADRILRLMRQRGELDYRVVSRRQSLYKVLPVAAQRELFL